MKKSPHKLPWELHDPKPAPRNCALDLSDAPPRAAAGQAIPQSAPPDRGGTAL